jgi:hypothetical protein
MMTPRRRFLAGILWLIGLPASAIGCAEQLVPAETHAPPPDCEGDPVVEPELNEAEP